MRYYGASFIFAVGVGLLVLGLFLILFFQLHYGSEPFKVKVTFTIIGIAVPIMVYGLSQMLSKKKGSMIIATCGFALSVFAVLLFDYYYPRDWFYPNVTYVAIIYASGLITLFGSSFADAVERIIESSSRTIMKIIHHEAKEEQKKKVEELPPLDAKFAFPTKAEGPSIEVKDIQMPPDLKPGKVFERPRVGKIVRVKDEVGKDAESLVRVRKGELKVKKSDSDILDVTKALKSMEEKMGKEDKKKVFGG